MRKLFETEDAWNGLILRVTLGIVMFPHGAQKLLGWYGGHGFAGTIGFIIGESLGSLGLLIGLLTRFAAGSLAVIMLGAIAMVHWPHGFFMNWFGKQMGEGFEYHLLVIGLSLALVITGGGKWSADRVIATKMQGGGMSRKVI